MKIFQTIQKQYVILGIGSSNHPTQKYPFNRRIVFGVFIFGILFTFQSMYIIREASGFMEYVECICTASGNIIIFICILAMILGKTKLYESIENIEKLIDTSQCVIWKFHFLFWMNWILNVKTKIVYIFPGCKYPKSMRFYVKISEQIERSNQIVSMVMMKISLQILMLPKFIVSFGTYLLTDSGSDSFKLPFPMW